jgi:DNA-binding phage protein
VRRLFSAEVNPELKTLTAIADALDAEVTIQPRQAAKQAASRRRRRGKA